MAKRLFFQLKEMAKLLKCQNEYMLIKELNSEHFCLSQEDLKVCGATCNSYCVYVYVP